jgi:hypothetical protein
MEQIPTTGIAEIVGAESDQQRLNTDRGRLEVELIGRAIERCNCMHLVVYFGYNVDLHF